MNKEYAIQILEMVERGALEPSSPLFKEASRYLKRLKLIEPDILDRLYKIEYK
jgi:hypothetical protein